MDDKKRQQILDQIFADDPMGILKVKPKTSSAATADERLIASFEEINTFYAEHQKEPSANISSVAEYQLYSRLKGLRDNLENSKVLEPYDKYHLLNNPKKEITSIDDIFEDDTMGIFNDGDDMGLFDFKHTPKPKTEEERAKADFVARRKPCKNFEEYEERFKGVQQDLASKKRKLVKFSQKILKAGDFYVHNGVLLYLESVDYETKVQQFKSGSRVRKDGRTRCIFENGTESKMLIRSLYKLLLANGQAVSQNVDKVDEDFQKKFQNITEDDQATGYIYVLQSLSTDPKISTIKNLYKIGYSTTKVAQRIKNAEKQPTYLMAPVKSISEWQCYNLNPQIFEKMMHAFFGTACLDLDIFDEKGQRHSPREWFIAPLGIINKAIDLIISGEISKYRYDVENEVIVGI